MYVPIDTTAKTLEELINEYDVLEGNPVGSTLTLITDRANREDSPTVGFDLDGITADIRVDGIYPATSTDAKLSSFWPLSAEKISYISLISDVPVNVPVLII